MPRIAISKFPQAMSCTQVEAGCGQLPGYEAQPGGAGHFCCLLEHHVFQGED